MTTLEHEQLFGGTFAGARDAHIFVSHDGRRQRILLVAGVVAGVLALAWLVALGLALAGSARTPALPLPTEQHRAPTAATHDNGHDHGQG